MLLILQETPRSYDKLYLVPSFKKRAIIGIISELQLSDLV